jgi:hypothetical protein
MSRFRQTDGSRSISDGGTATKATTAASNSAACHNGSGLKVSNSDFCILVSDI